MNLLNQFVLTCALGSWGAQAAANWEITTIAPLGGWYTSGAALNDRGEVVGTSSTSTYDFHAFLYSGGRLHDLGALGGTSSGATDINNAGQVVGWSLDANDSQRAFVYDAGGLRDITPAGAEHAGALAINQRGTVAGWSQVRNADGSSRAQAFIHDSASGATTRLGTLGGSHSHVQALNEAGQVAGQASLGGDVESRAYLYDDGRMTSLGSLGGTQTSATSLNEAGQVVGRASLRSGGQHAFLWNQGTLSDLGTFGGTSSRAADVNDRGQVVGDANLAGDDHTRAFLFDNGRMQDLGTLGGQSSQALGINNLGQVVGWAEVAAAEGEADDRHVFLFSDGVMSDMTHYLMQSFDSVVDVDPYSVLINDVGQVLVSATYYNGDRTLFLLSPAPEPGTYALMLAGLAALAVLRRRQRARARLS